MLPIRAARRRLAAAVAVVFALTATGAVLPSPATAAPSAGLSATGAGDQSVIAFPKGDVITGATASGYLTYNPATGRSWLPAAGGSPTKWPSSFTVLGTGSGDLVATYAAPANTTGVITDMATGSVVYSYYPGLATTGVTFAGAAGVCLFTTLDNAAGGETLRMHSKDMPLRTVTGLPDTATSVKVVPATGAHAQVTYATGTGTGTGTDTRRFLGLLDLAVGAVTETYELPAADEGTDIAVSATHVAWVEYNPTPDTRYDATVAVTDRSTGTRQNIPVGKVRYKGVKIGLQGSWVTFGDTSALNADEIYSSDALSAYDLTSGATRKLLDHFTSAVTAPDGRLFARGGTVAEDEGVYRIAPGQYGLPAATLVASTGEPTRVTLTGSNVPAVIDLDPSGSNAAMAWKLSRNNVAGTVTLRHVRTGKTVTAYFSHPLRSSVTFDWDGELEGPERGNAYNGAYTWTLVAKPFNGIGPDLASSGTFTVVRTAKPHDIDDNGAPNVLARDTAGRLWSKDTYYDPYNPGQLAEHETRLIGPGWSIYNQIEVAGNVGGSQHADLIARDGSGVLWLYLGTGTGGFSSRIRIGAGWQIYNKITGGTDYTGDGRADLLATDASGVLWLSRGTGNQAAPFATRMKVGGGWGVYNKLTAVGNVGGTAAGDLVARDGSGALWLYVGHGNGTFASRVRIGSGWNAYSDLVGIGDADHDGRPDLLAYDRSRNMTYLYRGTGNSSAPFATRMNYSPDNPTVAYNHLS
ncbi:VCBS repeat-containing protein [Streptomyces sp. NBC_00199]|uniref:FG-GAP repeat domain-containing protein n=1 Tax=Streptomyces sp. NBC_00199 TaxID=2975678 RepID=UPI0022563A9B|nr:VCBS repeat-containing protein [Streptomyces sp. NBC_00199]MCX5265735.1 VCBS repeat-containing protein [Streptomyces sp. NBC_00199]